jgi:hypothetical protein
MQGYMKNQKNHGVSTQTRSGNCISNFDAIMQWKALQ